MELYIQMRDGVPYEHPIVGDNFREAFPHIDVNNLPPEFAKFIRVECPFVPSTFQAVVHEYRFTDGVVKDYWAIREMTDQEKEHKRQTATEQVLSLVENIRKQAFVDYEAEHDLQNKQVWLQFIAALDSWVLVNPFYPGIPMYPAYNEQGVLFLPKKLPASGDLPGSTPNVIG